MHIGKKQHIFLDTAAFSILKNSFLLVMDLHSSFNLSLDEDHRQQIFILKDPKTKWKLSDLQISRSILINLEMQTAVAWIADIV